MHTVGTPLLWGIFAIVLVIMLSVDLLMQGISDGKAPSMQQATWWSLGCVAITLAFNIIFWAYLIHTVGRSIADNQALTFLTGYLLEKTMAVDNVFIWLTLFSCFSVPLSLQRRLLTWGILGAIILRSIIVFTGSWLVSQFQWLIYLFGIFLLFIGIKMILPIRKKQNISYNAIIRWVKRYLRVTDGLYGEYFFIYQNGMLFATPLLMALIMIEFSDLMFSLDSIPVIFAVTTDPFIVLTSNLFAVMGLRGMYFLLANIAERFSMLQYGLGAILVFISFKLLIIDIIHIPVMISLAVVVVILILTLLINAIVNRKGSCLTDSH